MQSTPIEPKTIPIEVKTKPKTFSSLKQDELVVLVGVTIGHLKTTRKLVNTIIREYNKDKVDKFKPSLDKDMRTEIGKMYEELRCKGFDFDKKPLSWKDLKKEDYEKIGLSKRDALELYRMYEKYNDSKGDFSFVPSKCKNVLDIQNRLVQQVRFLLENIPQLGKAYLIDLSKLEVHVE